MGGAQRTSLLEENALARCVRSRDEREGCPVPCREDEVVRDEAVHDHLDERVATTLDLDHGLLDDVRADELVVLCGDKLSGRPLNQESTDREHTSVGGNGERTSATLARERNASKTPRTRAAWRRAASRASTCTGRRRGVDEIRGTLTQFSCMKGASCFALRTSTSTWRITAAWTSRRSVWMSPNVSSRRVVSGLRKWSASGVSN